MGEVKFRNNKYYGNVNDAYSYSDFIQNLTEASDKVASDSDFIQNLTEASDKVAHTQTSFKI